MLKITSDNAACLVYGLIYSSLHVLIMSRFYSDCSQDLDISYSNDSNTSCKINIFR